MVHKRNLEKIGKVWYGGGSVVYKDVDTGREYIKVGKKFTPIKVPTTDIPDEETEWE